MELHLMGSGSLLYCREEFFREFCLLTYWAPGENEAFHSNPNNPSIQDTPGIVTGSDRKLEKTPIL
jgi:hypothetical protein